MNRSPRIIGPPDRPTAGLGQVFVSEGPAGPWYGPYTRQAPGGSFVECWWSSSFGWTCEPPNTYYGAYPWWTGAYAFGGGHGWRGRGGHGWRGHGGGWRPGFHPRAGRGMRGFGAVDPAQVSYEDFFVPKTALGWVYRILSIVGMVSGAYHGYKRNDSIGWAIGWGLLGGAFPFITIPVSLAQGFGKRRNPRDRRSRRRNSTGAQCVFEERAPGRWWYRIQRYPYGETEAYYEHGPFSSEAAAEAHLEANYGNPGGWRRVPFAEYKRRRNVKLKPGQKWRRHSGEAWKACSECAEPIGPFDSIAQAEAHAAECRRCSSLETATTGTYSAAKRRNRKRARVVNRRARGPYFYYARGFTLGRQGAPLAGLESMTGVERRAAQDGYAAGEMAMTAQAVTEAAGRRSR